MDLESVWPFFTASWDFLQSNFTQSFIGACAGAYCAQYIIERKTTRDTLLKEIRHTNAAIMIAFGICNSFLILKKQHIKKLKEHFEKQNAELTAFIEARRKGQVQPNVVFRFQADFKTLNPISIQIDILQNQIYEKLSLNGRPLSLTTILGQTVDSLNNSIQIRNQFIRFCRANLGATDNEALAMLYFGQVDPEGHQDRTYPDCVDAIYSYTDDGVYFSQKLCEDLHLHGERLKKQFGKGAPRINEPNFDIAANNGLMPDPKQYEEWEKAFRSSEPPKTWTGKLVDFCAGFFNF